jgi:hypothetical protein
MGTRGAIGWITPQNAVVASYNHYDSYPTGLGADLQAQLRELGRLPTITELSEIRIVQGDVAPTAEEKVTYAHLMDPNLGDRNEWYTSLRRQQGRIDLILESKIMSDGSDFPRDSLFCEWAYLVDTRPEESQMVILKGFNTTPDGVPDYLTPLPDENEGKRPSGTDYYFPCREVWRGSLEEFLALDMKVFQESFEAEEEAA